MTESNGVSDRLFELLSNPKGRDALDVQNEVNAQSTDAEQLVERAKSTDHPGELIERTSGSSRRSSSGATPSSSIAQRIPAALGDKDRRPAIASIAGQMQALLASDVIYLQRAVPELQRKFQQRGLDEQFPSDRFLPDLGWLDPATVASRLSSIGDLQKAATPGRTAPGFRA